MYIHLPSVLDAAIGRDKDPLRELMGNMATEAERCIRCGFCNSVCPTTLIESAFAPARTCRGRLVLLQSAISLGLPDPFEEEFKDLIDLCFGCMRCINVCPAGIPIPHVMTHYRHSFLERMGRSALSRGEKLIARYHEFAAIAARLAPFLRLALSNGLARNLVSRIIGVAADAPIPIPEGGTLDEGLRRMPPGNAKFAYFADTFARYVRPSIGMMAARLLRACGDSLILPPQRDSGITLMELGLFEELEGLARYNVDSLYEQVKLGRKVLTTSPAATLMLRMEYPRILGDEKSRAVSENVVDIHEYLLSSVNEARHHVKLRYREVVLHSTCFSQALRLTKIIRSFLEHIGCNVTEVREECCGIGGAWGLMSKHRKVSLEVGRKLFDRIRGRVVISNSETCTLQITGSGVARAFLPIEVLDLT